MDILKEIGYLVCIAFLGSLFNLFVLLLVVELVAGHYMFQYQIAENETRRHTAYTITIPDGITCNGHYYSGKNDPITVICLDGRKFVAQSIQVKGTVYYDPVLP